LRIHVARKTWVGAWSLSEAVSDAGSSRSAVTGTTLEGTGEGLRASPRTFQLLRIS
jgi:hypothetical protein